MTNNNLIFSYLESIYPNACCFLNYSNDYELLISVMLSAQTTDIKVNNVTNNLYKKYKNIDEFSNADIKDIEHIIKPLGLSKIKSMNIQHIIFMLKNEFNYSVPKDKNMLMSMNGVGNKTANCVLAELFNVPLLAVDTHVQRISKKIGWCDENDNPTIIEEKLYKIIPENNLIKINHQLILFGRNICKARTPLCEKCGISSLCNYYKNTK